MRGRVCVSEKEKSGVVVGGAERECVCVVQCMRPNAHPVTKLNSSHGICLSTSMLPSTETHVSITNDTMPIMRTTR